MKKQQLLAALSGTSLLLSNAMASADPLTGNVQIKTVRVARPGGTALSAGEAQKPFDANINDDSFKLNANSNQLPAQVDEVAPVAPAPLRAEVSQPELRASTTSSPLKGNAEKTGGTVGGGAQHASNAPIIDDYNAKKPLQGSVTFRICYYDLGDGAECCWEALREANYLKGRGVDIALLLDRGGVRLANKHNMHEEQLHRGSTEKMVKTQQLLKDFIEMGGTVYASERWARHFGLWGGSAPALTPGVKLENDEEMADLLVERSGRIVDY